MAVILLVLFSGCNSLQNTLNLQKPTASLKNVRLENISENSADLVFDVEIENPYPVALQMTSFDYEVASQAGYLFSGTADITGTVPAKSKMTVSLPAKPHYLDVVTAFEGISPGWKIPYQADVGLSMNAPDAEAKRLSSKKTGELEVPSIPKVEDVEKFIYTYEIDGLFVQTGDLICTTIGGDEPVSGQLWSVIGMIIPGDVDHIIVYIGPGGRCVEEGGKLYANKFEVKNKTWDVKKMYDDRGTIIDKLYGVVYPLAGQRISREEEAKIRHSVAMYCLNEAKARTPYNFNYFDSKTNKALYCSQLAHKAYLRSGIDLNTGKGLKGFPITDKIVYPQVIWEGWEHKKAGQIMTH